MVRTLKFISVLVFVAFATLTTHESIHASRTVQPNSSVSTQKPNNPTTLSMTFSTYLGGLRDDSIRDITTDAQGNIYVTGGAASPNFPTTTGPAFNSTPCSTLGTAGQMDVFITKLSPAGQILWSRLLGGPCYDRAYALKVDPQGYVYVAGRAGTGYPTTPGTVQTTFGGQDPSAYSYGAYGAQDGFITKLSPDGTQIVWSTFFGSNDWSFIRDIDLDSSGNVYLVMAAVGRPNQHITPGAFQTHLAGGEDMVVAKISADGSRAIWATYLGGSGDDGGGPSIRVDSTGHAYVLGTTNSTNFPTTLGAFQRTFGGTLDFVVTQFTSDGSGLVFSTYLGGSGEESTETHEIALDPQGNAYITGYVNSTNFPTTLGAFQRTSGGGYDVAVAKLSKDGTKLLASTYLGGSGAEGSQGIVIDAQGNVNIFGVTNSTNLPLSVSPYQPSNAGGDDFFVAKFSPDLSQLLFSTNLGGSGADQGRAGWIDSNGNVIVAGMTQSDNWPVRNAVQAKRAGDWDGAVAKFSSSGSTQVGPNKIYLPVVIR